MRLITLTFALLPFTVNLAFAQQDTMLLDSTLRFFVNEDFLTKELDTTINKKTYYKYDPEHRLTEEYSLKLLTFPDTFEKDKRTVHSYTNSQQRDTSTTYFGLDDEWIPYERTYHSFNGGDLIEQTMTELWDRASKGWEMVKRERFAYDSHGENTKYVEEELNESGVLDTTQMILTEYTKAGEPLVLTLIQYAQGARSSLVQRRIDYDSEGRWISDTTFNISSDTSQAFSYQERHYNEDGTIAHFYLFTINSSQTNWDTSSRISYQYHYAGMTTQTYREDYDPATGSWKPYFKLESMYDNRNLEIETKSSFGDPLMCTSRRERGYNEHDLMMYDRNRTFSLGEIRNSYEYDEFYYSPAQTDLTSSVQIVVSTEEMEVFPNPTKEKIYIGKRYSELSDVEWYTISGQLVQSQKVIGREIDVPSNSGAGMLVLRIRDDRGQEGTYQIMVRE